MSRASRSALPLLALGVTVGLAGCSVAATGPAAQPSPRSSRGWTAQGWIAQGWTAQGRTAEGRTAQPTRARRPAPPAPAAAVPRRWDLGEPSVTAAPARLAHHAPASGPVRVVTVRAVAGRPVVTVAVVHGRAAAVAALARSQRLPGALSVGLDAVLHAADAPVSREPAPSDAAPGTPADAGQPVGFPPPSPVQTSVFPTAPAPRAPGVTAAAPGAADVTAPPTAAPAGGATPTAAPVASDEPGATATASPSATGAGPVGAAPVGAARGGVVPAAAAVPALPRSNDALRAQEWALDVLHAEAVWHQQRATGVTVAVVDSGVDSRHADLAPVVVPGTDLVDGTAVGSDPNGHGTHVAGIIGAVAGDGRGVAGLAQGVRVLPVRVLGPDGEGSEAVVAQGIVWAVDHGARVVNLSMGGSDSEALGIAVRYALGRGAVVVAAAGNERQSGSPVSYPGAYPGVLAVAATTSTGGVAYFSSAGSYVSLGAPGMNILSTYPGGSYELMSGTSMAAPFVSASAAVLLAANPMLTPAQVASVLDSSADDTGARGRDSDTGYGIVDPYAGLCQVEACGTTAPPATTAPVSGPAPVPPAVVQPPAGVQPSVVVQPPVVGVQPPVVGVPPSAPAVPAPVAAPAPLKRPVAAVPARWTVSLYRTAARVRPTAQVAIRVLVRDAVTRRPVVRTAVSVCVKIAPSRIYTCHAARTDASGIVATLAPVRIYTSVLVLPAAPKRGTSHAVVVTAVKPAAVRRSR